MTVTSKGQVTFPKAFLRRLGVQKGDKLMARIEGKRLVLETAGKGVLDLVGKMPKLRLPRGKSVDQLIDEARDEYFSKVSR